MYALTVYEGKVYKTEWHEKKEKEKELPVLARSYQDLLSKASLVGE
jgi:hypothetical protein